MAIKGSFLPEVRQKVVKKPRGPLLPVEPVLPLTLVLTTQSAPSLVSFVSLIRSSGPWRAWPSTFLIRNGRRGNMGSFDSLQNCYLRTSSTKQFDKQQRTKERMGDHKLGSQTKDRGHCQVTNTSERMVAVRGQMSKVPILMSPARRIESHTSVSECVSIL